MPFAATKDEVEGKPADDDEDDGQQVEDGHKPGDKHGRKRSYPKVCIRGPVSTPYQSAGWGQESGARAAALGKMGDNLTDHKPGDKHGRKRSYPKVRAGCRSRS